MRLNLPKIDDWIVTEIKDALNAAPTIADVNDVVRHFAANVAALEQSETPEHRTMAIQIKNLAQYRRQTIRQECN